MLFLFYFSLFAILYIYLGYPLLVGLLSLVLGKKVQKGEYTPFVTILTAAYNEEDVIEQTIENKLALDYPADRLEMLVVSDASGDRTDAIVAGYADRGVRLIRQAPRAGKTAALNRAVPEAKGEIIVFSDANSIYASDALKKLVQNFKDPTVGYVTGKMIYTNPDGSPIGDGCTAYMKYENFLRAVETRLGSVVGVDGGIDAVRKDLYQPMNADQLPDFVLPLKVVEQGYRVVYEPEAVLKEASLKSAGDEYKMRVRVALRSFWALKDMHQLLSFKKFKRFAFQLWSHKVLRYGCFVFLVAAFFSNYVLWPLGAFYKLVFLVQILAYLAAIFSPLLEKKGYSFKIVYLCHYFALLNLASAHALVKFLMGKKQVIWNPRKG